MNRTLLSLTGLGIGIAATSICFASPAEAMSIGLVSPLQNQLNTVMNGLNSTGLFTSITTINNTSTLTSADLTGFDAVLTWTDASYVNPTAVGDALKTYVDNGGGLVAGIYSLSEPWSLEGAIRPELPLQVGPNNTDPGDNLVAVIPNDPIFNGIDLNSISFFTNSNYTNPVLGVGAQLLADNGNGINMIARNSSGNIIAANMFPGFGGQGDFFKLYGNMLVSSANPVDTQPVPTPALLPGLIGIAVTTLRKKRKSEIA